MKLKSVKCPVCYSFYAAFRSHCPYCGCVQFAPGINRDYSNGKELVRGLPLVVSDLVIDRVIQKAAEHES